MNALALTLWMLTAPTVTVEVHAEGTHAEHDSEPLRAWLAMRLLQEGFDLAPDPKHADAVVTLTPAPEGMRIATVGARGRYDHVVEHGPTTVLRLEALHRALIGLDATASARELPRDRGLVIRFDDAVDEALLVAIATAAREQGIALVADAQPDDLLGCVRVRDEALEVGFGYAQQGCAPRSLVITRRSDPSHGAADLVIEARHWLSPEIAVDDVLDDEPAPPRSLPPIVHDDGDPVALHGPPRAEVRFGADGGIVTRGAIDAAMRVMIRLGRYRGFGGGLELMVIPSGNAGVRVVDTVLMVGPDWQVGIGKRTRFHVGVSAGADIQTSRISDRTAADVSWIVGMPTAFSFALRGETRLHLAALPALSGVAREHRVDEQIGWERTFWRVGLVLGFSHGWRIE